MQSTGSPIVKRVFGYVMAFTLCAALVLLMQPVSTIALEGERGSASMVVSTDGAGPAPASSLEDGTATVPSSAQADRVGSPSTPADDGTGSGSTSEDAQQPPDGPEPADAVTSEASDASPLVASDASPVPTKTATPSDEPSSLSSSAATPAASAAATPAATPTDASIVRISGSGTEEDPYVLEVDDTPAGDGTVTQAIDKTLLGEDWADRRVYVEVGGQRVSAPDFARTLPAQEYGLGETYRAYVLEDLFDHENEPTALTVPAHTVMIKNLGRYDKEGGTIELYDRAVYYQDSSWEKAQQGETYGFDGNDHQWFFPSVLERGYLIFASGGMAGGPTAYAYEQESEYVLVDVDLRKLMPAYFNEQGQYASNAGWMDNDTLLEMQDFLFVSGSVITLVTPDGNGHAQVYIRRPSAQETGNQSVGMYGAGHGGAFLTTSVIQVSRFFKLVTASTEDPGVGPVDPGEVPTVPGGDVPQDVQVASGEEQETRASEPAVVQASSRVEQQAPAHAGQPVESVVPRTDDPVGSMLRAALIGAVGCLVLACGLGLRRGNRGA
ncbi:MAG: hypothetical protein Q4A93_07165 [Actinomycetota bacterium]|nr:hypothetical protein [Actinomycetota bacterium]